MFQINLFTRSSTHVDKLNRSHKITIQATNLFSDNDFANDCVTNIFPNDNRANDQFTYDEISNDYITNNQVTNNQITNLSSDDRISINQSNSSSIVRTNN